MLVEILAHSPDARRAAVSWPLVPAGGDRRRMLKAWSRVSGLSIARVDAIGDMLFAHRVCLPDRTVDPDALRVIEHLAAEVLRKRSGQ